MLSQQKNRIISLLLSVLILVLYWNLGFNSRPLSDYSGVSFVTFICQYFILFALVLLLIKRNNNFWFLMGLTLLANGMYVFTVPNLSPDFYRFIWDGELLTKGINPYAHVPNELISFNGFYDSQYMRMLYYGMTDLSKEHYSNYPVLNQFLYAAPAYFSESIQGNVIGLKLILLAFNIGNVFVLKKLLNLLKLPLKNIWFYALNPFVIIELMGNMHFEGVMVFFMLSAIYVILKNENWMLGATYWAFAIQIKLIPLMLVPFFFKKLGFKKSVGFGAVTGVLVLLIGQFLWNEQLYINHMLESINDYFISFQFNASWFNVVNALVSDQYGWNTTYLVGPWLSKITLGLVVVLALFRNYRSDLDVFKGMLFALMIYYALATTVHPWYISMILVLGIFTDYKFPLVWTLLVPLSYGIYVLPEYELYILGLEYGLLFAVMIYEIKRYWQSPMIKSNWQSFFNVPNK